MSGVKAFFDTNILIYMYLQDSAEQHFKACIARKLFSDCFTAERGLLSTQVIQEFYAVGTRKLGMTRQRAYSDVVRFLKLPLVIVGPEHIAGAIDNEAKYQVSFWDGLIVAAAEAGGAEVLYTEDLSDGQMYGGVKAVNPFVQG